MTDLNDLTTEGYYWVNLSEVSNSPFNGTGYVHVKTINNIPVQEAIAVGLGNISHRVKYDTGWTDWKTVVLKDDLVTLSNTLFIGEDLSLKNAILSYVNSRNNFSIDIVVNNPKDNVFKQYMSGAFCGTIYYSKFFWSRHPQFVIFNNGIMAIGSMNADNNTIDNIKKIEFVDF